MPDWCSCGWQPCLHSSFRSRQAQKDIDKMLSRVVRQPDGCWLWQGALSGVGYGIVWADGRLQSVHRLSFAHFVRPLTDGECVLHRCDVRNCVAPDHLFVGTRADNMADMWAKGRARPRQWKTCGRGHAWTVENTRFDTRGDRCCRTCQSANGKAWRARRKSAE